MSQSIESDKVVWEVDRPVQEVLGHFSRDIRDILRNAVAGVWSLPIQEELLRDTRGDDSVSQGSSMLIGASDTTSDGSSTDLESAPSQTDEIGELSERYKALEEKYARTLRDLVSTKEDLAIVTRNSVASDAHQDLLACYEASAEKSLQLAVDLESAENDLITITENSVASDTYQDLLARYEASENEKSNIAKDLESTKIELTTAIKNAVNGGQSLLAGFAALKREKLKADEDLVSAKTDLAIVKKQTLASYEASENKKSRMAEDLESTKAELAVAKKNANDERRGSLARCGNLEKEKKEIQEDLQSMKVCLDEATKEASSEYQGRLCLLAEYEALQEKKKEAVEDFEVAKSDLTTATTQTELLKVKHQDLVARYEALEEETSNTLSGHQFPEHILTANDYEALVIQYEGLQKKHSKKVRNLDVTKRDLTIATEKTAATVNEHQDLVAYYEALGGKYTKTMKELESTKISLSIALRKNISADYQDLLVQHELLKGKLSKTLQALEIAKAEFDTATKRVTTLQNRNRQELQKQRDQMKAAHERKIEELTKGRGKKDHLIMEKRNTDLTRDAERLAKRIEELQSASRASSTYIKKLEAEALAFGEQWSEEKQKLTKRITNLAELLESATNRAAVKQDREIRELKNDRDTKALLVDIGVSIRKRFLEQERVSPAYGLATKADMKRDVIDMGHDAAHRGNFFADQAMFKAGLISKEYDAAFFTIYRVGSMGQTRRPPDVGLKCSTMIKALNCRVSVEAGMANHHGLGTATERALAMKVWGQVLDLWNEPAGNAWGACDNDFEQDQRVKDLVAELERLTSNLTASYRLGYGRRR